MSTADKMSLVEIALSLRDEQLQAQVVHYKAELETSPELDAVTAQVVQQLGSLRAAARAHSDPGAAPRERDRAEIEIELIAGFKRMLGRIFRPGRLATTIERRLGEVSKRFAKVFFESELHEKIRGTTREAKTMRFVEQAVYCALSRAQEHVELQLQELTYSDPEIHQKAKDRFSDLVRELRNDFLGRTTPELNILARYLNDVLTAFFTTELPPALGELAWEVVREARLANETQADSLTICASAFPAFRSAFEKGFLQRLVPFVEDEMLARVRDNLGQFRSETIRLVADPLIFRDVCHVMCEAVYDMLYIDGFLDLPSDWRARLAAPTTS